MGRGEHRTSWLRRLVSARSLPVMGMNSMKETTLIQLPTGTRSSAPAGPLAKSQAVMTSRLHLRLTRLRFPLARGRGRAGGRPAR